MKKRVLAGLVAGAMSLSLVACGGTTATTTPATDTTDKQVEDALNEITDAITDAVSDATDDTTADDQTTADTTSEDTTTGVMTYADYLLADLDSEVTVDCYVQDNQSWWDNKITVYAADEDGAYFIYNLACDESMVDAITPGTHLLVTGYKTEWQGEVEITDATFEVADDTKYVAAPVDVTAALGTEAINDYANQFVTFTGLKIAPSNDADGNEVAFLYNWDGSGSQGDDIYFNVEDANGAVYQFCVESYLRGPETEVYQAAEALQIGQEVECDGFLYFYNGINPHITNIR